MKFLDTKLKKILNEVSKVVLLLTMFVIIFSPFSQISLVSVALADTPKAGDTTDLRNATSFDTCITAGGDAAYCQNTFPPINKNINNQGAAAGATGNTGKVGAPPTSDDALACSLSNPSICLANVVYAFTVGLGGGLAYVGGFMLDTTVSLSLNSAAYALTFLSSGWTAARDLANMAFILILVYIAFMIMFEAETAGTIRTLAWVIFIALIINFSFFFTRVVIDVSNILAVQFYNSIQAPTLQQTMDTTSAQTGVLANAAAGAAIAASPQGSLANTKDLTYSIMTALNMQQLFSDANFKSFANQSGFGTKFIVLSFLYLTVGACYFILAAMFFAVGIKFIVRVVVLWFLIIASPLAFVCKAVPRKEVSVWYDKWQHELINHAFYPAFFLFIFFFISSIMSSFGGSNDILGGIASSLNAAASNPNLSGFIFIASSVATIAIRLGFVIAMLYIALKASEYMGVQGAGIAHNITNRVGGIARYSASLPVRGAFAGTALTGRNVVGRGAYIASRSAPIQNLAANSIFGRPVKAALGTLEKASFDIRGTSIGKNLKSFAGEAGGKGGFSKQISERAKNIEDRAKELKATDETMLRTAQYKFENNYVDPLGNKGKGAFDARLRELTRQKETGTKEQKRQAEKELKDLQEGGKKQIEEAGKERIRAFAERMSGRNIQNLGMPSRGSIEGASKAKKIIGQKSKEQEVADAIKKFTNGDTEEAAPATSAATPAAIPAAAPAGPSSHALTAQSMNRTRNMVPLSDATERLERALKGQVEAMREATKEQKESGARVERGFTGIHKTVKEVLEKNGKDTKRFEKLVTASAPHSPTTQPGSRDVIERGRSGRPIMSAPIAPPVRPASAPAPAAQAHQAPAPIAPTPIPPPKPPEEGAH